MPDADVPTGKALRVFREIITLEGAPFSPKEQSTRLGIPTPNLYRHLDVLMKSGLLVRVRRSHYLPHPRFLKSLESFTARDVLRSIVRPPLEKAARQIPATFHFGVLEADMVTYISKVDHHNMDLFTKEDMQLEAYCSAIGKVLLATLPSNKLNEYLSAFEFPKLTENTITDPKEIRLEIAKTKRRGYGVDNREIREDLVCIAVPVTMCDNTTIGAVSAASVREDLAAGAFRKKITTLLNDVADKIRDIL